MIAAQDDEQVGHHSRLAFLVQLHDVLLVEPGEGQLDHAHRAFHDPLACGHHGFGLLGLVIQAVTGERFTDWMQREIIDAAGLRETCADVPAAGAVPLMANGHSPTPSICPFSIWVR